MKNSLRFRLIANYGLLVLISILTMEFTLYFAVEKYFYNDAKTKLKSQAELNLGYLYRYIDFSKGLENVILEDGGTLFQYNTGHLEILNNEGNHLISTIGLTCSPFDKSNVLSQIKEKGYFSSINDFAFSDERLISVGLPIMYQQNQIGIAVFQASLTEADTTLRTIRNLLLLLGILIVAAAFLISNAISKEISSPIAKLNEYSKRLAKGEYDFELSPSGTMETVSLGESMNKMKEEIIKREEIKNEFIANVSHELKTPLTSIKGWAYTLHQDFSDPGLTNEGLTIIETESDRLAVMVNELLDFSRLLNKNVKIQCRSMELIGFLKNIEMLNKPRAVNEMKNISLVTDISSLNIFADEDKLKQVFINLIDNAFKFTQPDGNITISVLYNSKSPSAVIKVTDDGEGIDEKDMGRVFEKFYRGKSKKSHTGIGLAIVDEIIKLHGGTISVSSVKGEGSEFVITLPIGNTCEGDKR